MAESKAAAPASEIGYISEHATDMQLWNQDERVPELKWPRSIEVYSRMPREDGRAASVLQAIGLPIRRTTWRLAQNGASDEVTDFVALNLGLPREGTDPGDMPRRRGRFSWAQHLRIALLSLKYGHSYFEQVYRYDKETDRIMLHKLAPRPSKTISDILVAPDGGLVSIKQYAPAQSGRIVHGLKGVEIPVSSLVAYVRDPEPGDWIGESILRPAYKHWILKDEFMRVQAGTARRNGMGVPVGTASGKDQVEVDRMGEVASNYRSGDHSGVGLANGQTLTLEGVKGNLPDMQPPINFHDKSIALAALAHFLNLDRGGSHALASVQADVFTQSVQTYAESIQDIANAHIVEDLVDINFGEAAPAPRIIFDEIGSQQDATAAALAILVQNDLLEPDEALRVTLRQKYRLPAPDRDPSIDDEGDSE